MVDTIQEYLQAHIDIYKNMGQPAAQFEMYLKQGKEYKPAPLPEDLQELRGEMKMCFSNCYEAAMTLVMLGDEQYAYCEGYAYGMVFPVHHAWLTDGEYAYDLTWEEGYGRQYYGVAFDPEWLENWSMATGSCGILTFDFIPTDEHVALLQSGEFPPESLWSP